jgi:hypothetical protein
MEIAGELSDFHKAIAKVEGLEFLSEEIEDKVDPDEFAAIDSKGKEHRYSRQLFLVASKTRRLATTAQSLGALPKGRTISAGTYAVSPCVRASPQSASLERQGPP